jgi:hypothetical protein
MALQKNFLPMPQLRNLLFTFIAILILITICFINTKNNVFINYLFPPYDFNNSITESVIQFNTKGTIFEANFINKYPGKYSLMIFTEKPITMDDSFNVNIKSIVLVRQGEKLILEKNIVNCRSWVQKSNEDTAFYFFNYSVPQDLPLRDGLKMKIDLLEENNNISNKYGRTKAVLMKISDE